MTTATAGDVREFVLVQARGDVTPVIRAVDREDRHSNVGPISGLPIWLRPDFALARVGPRTLAIGAPAKSRSSCACVSGLAGPEDHRPALRSLPGARSGDGVAFDLERSAELVAFLPARSSRASCSIPRKFSGSAWRCKIRCRARLILKMKTAKAASDLAAKCARAATLAAPAGFRAAALRAAAGGRDAGTDVEMRFDVPENSARLLLQRVAKSNAAPHGRGEVSAALRPACGRAAGIFVATAFRRLEKSSAPQFRFLLRRSCRRSVAAARGRDQEPALVNVRTLDPTIVVELRYAGHAQHLRPRRSTRRTCPPLVRPSVAQQAGVRRRRICARAGSV